jgi:hypothetical protein
VPTNCKSDPKIWKPSRVGYSKPITNTSSFEKMHQKSIHDYNFKPGALVPVRNSSTEMELNKKTKPRYFGPMVVVSRSQRAAYSLADLDGSVSKLHYAAFRIIPYYARSQASIPVTRVVELSDKKLKERLDEDDLIDLSPSMKDQSACGPDPDSDLDSD